MSLIRALFAFSIFSFLLTSSLLGMDEIKENHVSPDPLSDSRLSPYPPHTLIGSDVLLRPVFPSDWEYFKIILTDPTQMKYFGTGETFTDIRVERWAAEMVEDNSSLKNLKLDLKESGRFYYFTFFTPVGFSGCIFLSNRPNRDDIDVDRFELSYFGRGGTAKAANLLIDYVKNPLLATIHPKNTGSQNVLKKLGFVPDLTRQGVYSYGSIRDYYLLDRPKKG